MRVYEWLLKELSQRKTHKGNIEISIKEFKFMLMLEKNYPLYAELNRWILKPVENDLNTYSNMKLVIEKRGRPADTLIFQVELDKKINLNTNAGELNLPEPILNVNVNLDTRLKKGVVDVLDESNRSKIQLSKFESNFLQSMNSKFDLNGSFSWITDKQRKTLENLLVKYGKL